MDERPLHAKKKKQLNRRRSDDLSEYIFYGTDSDKYLRSNKYKNEITYYEDDYDNKYRDEYESSKYVRNYRFPEYDEGFSSSSVSYEEMIKKQRYLRNPLSKHDRMFPTKLPHKRYHSHEKEKDYVSEKILKGKNIKKFDHPKYYDSDNSTITYINNNNKDGIKRVSLDYPRKNITGKKETRRQYEKYKPDIHYSYEDIFVHDRSAEKRPEVRTKMDSFHKDDEEKRNNIYLPNKKDYHIFAYQDKDQTKGVFKNKQTSRDISLSSEVELKNHEYPLIMFRKNVENDKETDMVYLPLILLKNKKKIAALQNNTKTMKVPMKSKDVQVFATDGVQQEVYFTKKEEDLQKVSPFSNINSQLSPEKLNDGRSITPSSLELASSLIQSILKNGLVSPKSTKEIPSKYVEMDSKNIFKENNGVINYQLNLDIESNTKNAFHNATTNKGMENANDQLRYLQLNNPFYVNNNNYIKVNEHVEQPLTSYVEENLVKGVGSKSDYGVSNNLPSLSRNKHTVERIRHFKDRSSMNAQEKIKDQTEKLRQSYVISTLTNSQDWPANKIHDAITGENTTAEKRFIYQEWDDRKSRVESLPYYGVHKETKNSSSAKKSIKKPSTLLERPLCESKVVQSTGMNSKTERLSIIIESDNANSATDSNVLLSQGPEGMRITEQSHVRQSTMNPIPIKRSTKQSIVPKSTNKQSLLRHSEGQKGSGRKSTDPRSGSGMKKSVKQSLSRPRMSVVVKHSLREIENQPNKDELPPHVYVEDNMLSNENSIETIKKKSLGKESFHLTDGKSEKSQHSILGRQSSKKRFSSSPKQSYFIQDNNVSKASLGKSEQENNKSLVTNAKYSEPKQSWVKYIQLKSQDSTGTIKEKTPTKLKSENSRTSFVDLNDWEIIKENNATSERNQQLEGHSKTSVTNTRNSMSKFFKSVTNSKKEDNHIKAIPSRKSGIELYFNENKKPEIYSEDAKSDVVSSRSKMFIPKEKNRKSSLSKSKTSLVPEKERRSRFSSIFSRRKSKKSSEKIEQPTQSSREIVEEPLKDNEGRSASIFSRRISKKVSEKIEQPTQSSREMVEEPLKGNEGRPTSIFSRRISKKTSEKIEQPTQNTREIAEVPHKDNEESSVDVHQEIKETPEESAISRGECYLEHLKQFRNVSFFFLGTTVHEQVINILNTLI